MQGCSTLAILMQDACQQQATWLLLLDRGCQNRTEGKSKEHLALGIPLFQLLEARHCVYRLGAAKGISLQSTTQHCLLRQLTAGALHM